MAIDFRPVAMPEDRPRLLEFLCGAEWPYHGTRFLTPDDVDTTDFASSDAASFWIRDGGHDASIVGLVRAFDLDDIGQGSPLFDLRVGEEYRGRGIGTLATRWLVDHVFATYPLAHRVEATTRDDNLAMQSALRRAGFVEEGRLRDAWWSEDGGWYDTVVFGILRRDVRLGEVG